MAPRARTDGFVYRCNGRREFGHDGSRRSAILASTHLWRSRKSNLLHLFIYPLTHSSAQTDIRSVLPSDIGAAAAFEAWRNWQAHNSIYAQPLAGDTERMREALVGLAIAEGEHLL